MSKSLSLWASAQLAYLVTYSHKQKKPFRNIKNTQYHELWISHSSYVYVFLTLNFYNKTKNKFQETHQLSYLTKLIHRHMNFF